ncbi:ExeM/NucH family extracellular endonuclease [Nocardioides sp. GXZ039]|uniref:ExeM/NucH family extracellular endonuclease n=1 Tax=Nocardioides sp. GXZ039 TaxID=3136018 RepID=UPI0030F4724A
MSKHALGRRGLTGVVAGALVATPLVLGLSAAPSQAAVAGDLVINEVFGGGGNSGAPYNADFVELYNPTSAPISLTGRGLQYRSSNGGSGGVAALRGSVPAGSTYLIQVSDAGANGAPVDADLTTQAKLTMSGTAGQVLLLTSTTAYAGPAGDTTAEASVIDMVGYGPAANTFEGAPTGANLSNSTSASRNGSHADTNNNAADFTNGAPTPTKSTGGGTGALAATNPGNQAATVDQPIAPITLAATGGSTPYTWAVEGLPAGLSATPAGVISGTPTATGSSNVTATVTDSASASASTSFTITVAAANAVTPIADIQGTGSTTPVNGQNVTTEGVVTAAYPTGGLNGFYIQTPGADTTPDASDAVFVYGGTSGFTTYPAVGDSVRVTGQAGEFNGQTQVTASQSGVSPVAGLGEVAPKAQIPGTDCALPGVACLAGAELDEAREKHEGELFKPTAPWTATDVYDGGPFYQGTTNSTAFRGEIGLAADSDLPLVAPTELIDAQDSATIAERVKYNNAHRIILDDGSSWTYSTTQNSDKPFPWFTAEHTVRVGAAVTFDAPVVFTGQFGTWRILPQSQVVGVPTGKISFEQDRPAQPEDVGGDVKLATFNVLNYFPTTGEEFVSSGQGTCTYYRDRAGNAISNNRCEPEGPRGAANQANLERQQAKIVEAINTADADVVSLEELENSVKFGKNRDFAINQLVAALNADAGAGTWAAVPSPATLPPVAQQDVIRNGFIYQPANVELVGESVVLSNESDTGGAFEDAREPLAQAFKKVGTPDADAFAVIVNHFKSKGSGTPDPDGQGNSNDRRILQAQSLVSFANSFKAQREITRVFLAGDFNAYSKEDPIQVLTAAGYTNLDSTSDPDEESYNFDGMVGSLDHVLANDAALADVNAVDIWEINGYESVYYEYARFNSNVTNLYSATPFRSSDHSPEIVGINVGTPAPTTRDIQILGTNDFHGRIENNPSGTEAGAAVLAGAVKQFRAQSPDTVFAAAGDLVGATTFTSFIQNDKPTIDALNEAGLDVSAAGNHEFDQGYDDLINRIMAPESADNPDGGAEWKYISANLKLRDSGDPALDPSFVKTFGDVEVGFVGAVTEELPSLVSPAGIADIEVEPIVSSVNAEADRLKAEGVDVIVLLVHEGAASPALADSTNPNSPFGKIVNGVDKNVDAIISGHTHQAYNHSIPVPEWVAEGRAVTERPVVSSGQYGSNLNRLVFTVDEATGKVTAKTQQFLPLKSGQTANYPSDPATAQIVADAVAEAAPLGAVPLGTIAGPFSRAKFGDGTRENRGGESTLGNLVAEVQRWATEKPESGSAQIALMNPGGLRADMVGNPGDFPRTLTYKQAADVQPFANTLVNMSLTGAQLETVLEQQWQLTAAGVVPSRPFLKLGVSEGFEYTYTTSAQPTPNPDDGDATYTQGEITSMALNGEPIVDSQSYSVTVNSFLASGGDNFRELAKGSGARDTGKVDLQAMVDYMAEFAAPGGDPLPVDYSQRAVGVTAVDSPVTAGTSVSFDLTSLIMTGAVGTAPNQILDVKDNEVTVTLDGELLGGFPVDQTITNPGTGSGEADKASSDEFGKASVAVTIPATTTDGAHDLVIKGEETGTEITVPITVEGGVPAQVDTTTSVTVSPAKVAVKKDKSTFKVTVSASGYIPTGKVEIVQGGKVVGSGTLAADGTVSIAAGPWQTVGTLPVTVRYLGDARAKASETSTTVTVVKQTPTIKAKAKPATVKKGKATTVTVTLKGVNAKVTGKVKFKIGKKTVTRKVTNGKAVLKIKKVTKRTKVKVTYLGDANFAKASTKVIVKVKR